MKRTVAVLVVGLLAVTGCGNGARERPDGSSRSATASSSAEPSPTGAASAGASYRPGPDDVVIWADPKRAAAISQLAGEPERTGGVRVRVETITTDLRSTLAAAPPAAAPDLIVGTHDLAGGLINDKSIDPVPLSAAQRGKFLGFTVKALTVDDEVYGVPYSVASVALIRNTDLAPDPPRTIEEAISIGNQLISAGQATHPLALPVGEAGDPMSIYPLYSSAGGYLFKADDDGDYDRSQFGLGTPESISAFDRIARLGERNPGGALRRSIDQAEAIRLFTQRQTPYLVAGLAAVAAVKRAGISYDISPVPGFYDAKTPQPLISIGTFFLGRHGRHKEAAVRYLTEALTQTALPRALYTADPWPPALESTIEQLKETDPDVQKFLDAGRQGVPIPALDGISVAWRPLGSITSAIVGGADVQATVVPAGLLARAELGPD